MPEDSNNYRAGTRPEQREPAEEGESEDVKKRLNAEIPAPMHANFKAKTAKEGRKMTSVVRELVEKYLNE